MPRADLTIRLHDDGLTPYLRAWPIADAPVLAIARALHDDPQNHLLDALLELGRVASANHRDGEIDDLINDVETLADIKPAELDLTRTDLDQLAREAAGVVDALKPRAVGQQERGAAA